MRYIYSNRKKNSRYTLVVEQVQVPSPNSHDHGCQSALKIAIVCVTHLRPELCIFAHAYSLVYVPHYLSVLPYTFNNQGSGYVTTNLKGFFRLVLRVRG